MQLDARTNKILQLITEAYIETAQPVSSKAVAQRGKGLGLGPATIRAVMAELETAGLLAQPHTSAGRIPTELGMRAYLDGLVATRLRPWDRTHLEAATADADGNNFAQSLGHSLAGLSGQVACISAPRFLGTCFREVGLMRCAAGRFVCYFVSPRGFIQQKLVEVDFDLSAAELNRIQNYLNEKLANRTLPEIRRMILAELADAQATCDTLRRTALEIGQRALGDLDVEVDVVVEGASHLVDQPEFADVAKLRLLLRAIEDRQALLKLLDRIIDTRGVKVMLGSEHDVAEMPDVACVGAWAEGAGPHTAITLLGPARMDYERLMPLVGYATQLFERFWRNL